MGKEGPLGKDIHKRLLQVQKTLGYTAPVSPSGSHPAIQFKQIPVVSGPLFQLESSRARILKDVAEKTQQNLQDTLHQVSSDILLGEALYQEKSRLKKERDRIFTYVRKKKDRELWSSVQSALKRPGAEVDRHLMIQKVIQHYSEEIGGHFDPKLYPIATRVVPWMFNWLLNAASVRRFLPWGMTESLSSRLDILGEVPQIQNLAKKGTILLVPTHQSNIDSILIGYVIYLMSLPPFAYGAGLNLFSNPVLSFFMSNLGAYTVDRKKFNLIYKETLKSYSTCILKEGMHSVFFPGGGRSRTGAIETKLKLGLLGTGIQAEIENHQNNRPNPRIFIVPMVTSYHFVLEASSLIEEYLAESGKHRFMPIDEDPWHPTAMARFFWKLFSSQSGVTVRVGRPLDVFGNDVDEEGRSIGPNGTLINPVKWLTTKGQVCSEPQRDEEYTRQLGIKVAERFHKGNTVLSSHLVAFTFFESLRSKYPDFDLYRFLRLSIEQRSMPLAEFLQYAEKYYRKIAELADRGGLFLAEDLKNSNTQEWVFRGVKELGPYHEAAVIRISRDVVYTEDMNLLYYYRNRLVGYGLSQCGKVNTQGFLA